MSVPKDTTIAVVEAELEAVCAYSERHDLTVEWNPQELIVSVAGCHPANNDPIQFHADVSDYRAVAPAWTVTSSAKDHAFPKNGSLPNGKGSMFNGKGVICAHFNRLT